MPISSLHVSVHVLTQAIVGRDPSDSGGLLCLAMSAMVAGDTTEARAVVKRLLRKTPSVANMDDWLKGWLLLADTFIDNGKYEQVRAHSSRGYSEDERVYAYA